MLAKDPKVLAQGFLVTWVELPGIHHGRFSDGTSFLSPLSMPCVVPFLDQALYPVGVGDSGLVLTEHSQFHLLMQDQSAPEQEKNLSTTSVQQKLSSASDTQFSQFVNQIEHNESPRAADPRHYQLFR